jgi:hypothetical protein
MRFDIFQDGTVMATNNNPVTAVPTGASHRRSSSGISDDAAKTAHDFMAGTIRRSSNGVTDDAARAAREVYRSLACTREKKQTLHLVES